MDITIRIEGMHCGGCVRSVEKAAATVAGVDSVAVSLERGELTARADRPERAAEVAAAVSDAGFDAVVA